MDSGRHGVQPVRRAVAQAGGAFSRVSHWRNIEFMWEAYVACTLRDTVAFNQGRARQKLYSATVLKSCSENCGLEDVT